jgi:hypothetical protein
MSNESTTQSASPRPTPSRLNPLHVARAVGALALFLVGGVHLEQYYVASFSVVPTIGWLFLANFIAATVFGLALLVPIRRGAGRTWLLIDSVAALGGMALSVSAFTGLLVSERTALFGFMEHGYRFEIVFALAAEAVATVSLGVFLAYVASWTPRLRRREPTRRRPTPASPTPTASES